MGLAVVGSACWCGDKDPGEGEGQCHTAHRAPPYSTLNPTPTSLASRKHLHETARKLTVVVCCPACSGNEAEAARLEAEQAARLAAEEEAARVAQEEEAERIAAEEEQARQAA